MFVPCVVILLLTVILHYCLAIDVTLAVVVVAVTMTVYYLLLQLH